MILYPGSNAYGRTVDGLPPVICQNMYPERVPEELGTDWVLVSTPGQNLFSDIPGCIRGAFSSYGVFDGDIFSVFDEGFYRTDVDGNSILIPGVPVKGLCSDRVIFTSVRGYIVFSTAGCAFVYDGTSVTQVNDPDLPFTNIGSVTAMDGRIVYMEQGTDQIWWSDIFAPGSVLGLNFATAETFEDTLVRVIADHRELWLFGQTTIEIWRPVEDAAQPFQRVGDMVLEKGTLSPYSVVKADNTLFWVGQDSIVYRAEGAGFRRVSNHGIERDLEDLTQEELAAVYAFSYTDDGHIFYVLTIPGLRTYVFDASTQSWTTRKTRGQETWEPHSYVEAFTQHYVHIDGAIQNLSRDHIYDRRRSKNDPIERIVSVNIPTSRPIPLARMALVVACLGSDTTILPPGIGADAVTRDKEEVTATMLFSFSDDAGRSSNIPTGGNAPYTHEDFGTPGALWSDEQGYEVHYHQQYHQRIQIFRQGQIRSPGRTYRIRTETPGRWMIGPVYINDAMH